MDVLRPTLIRIGGRVYRKNLIQEQAYQHEEEEEDFCAGNECCVRTCYGWNHPPWWPRELLEFSLMSLRAQGPAPAVEWGVQEGEKCFALVLGDAAGQRVHVTLVTECGFGCLCCWLLVMFAGCERPPVKRGKNEPRWSVFPGFLKCLSFW